MIHSKDAKKMEITLWIEDWPGKIIHFRNENPIVHWKISASKKQCYSIIVGSLAWSWWIITTAFQTTNISGIYRSTCIHCLSRQQKCIRKTFLPKVCHRKAYHLSWRSCVSCVEQVAVNTIKFDSTDCNVCCSYCCQDPLMHYTITYCVSYPIYQYS